MGSLEDYYAKREAEAARHGNAIFVPYYNRLLDIVREITAEVFIRICNNPPNDYEWIDAGYTRYVGWQLWSDWDGSRFFYLIGTGDVASVSAATTGTRKVMGSIVQFGHLSEPFDQSQYKKEGVLALETLRDLSNSVVQFPHRYGFTDDPRHTGWWQDGCRSS